MKAIPGLDPAPAGAISVSLGGRNYPLETSLQVNPFYCGRDMSYLLPLRPMEPQEKLWWALCIKENRYRYNFGRQANRTLATLELPDEIPRWVWQAHVPQISASASATYSTPDLRTDDWRPFTFEQLFNLERGRRFLRRDLRPGKTPYVRASALNNGVSQHVDLPPAFPGGLITVSCNGSVGEAFVQPEPFVASDDIVVLVPKEQLSKAASFFLCTVIRAEKYRFNYGRKWFTDRMRKSVLHLPVQSDGHPDWLFAEQYVRSLPMASLVL
ncbi:restriction endonuclease subunit S [Micromonospora sp. AMSO31t]|uniref:restriction endonuclease subunit S n=1 Tax=Micromonospora sp. AMSO31t TaxID=2650566 RepID=UPI001788D400|nr:restriction endonuclease subunit S [Micromonospora sp. AMSO31t]